MNPVFTGLSLSLFGVRTPLILGAYVPRWDRSANDALAGRQRLHLRDLASAQIARVQQSQAAALLIASPQALSRISAPARHRDRIYEVPHGIDLAQFVERATVPSRPSILFLAAVSRKKGVFTLLDAFETVARALPDCELTIAGPDGGALAEVRDWARTAPARVTIAGPVARAQVHDMMRAHSVFCVPSYGEPFGMSNLEAMACGVPVVSTRAGGIPDLITESGGRLVPPRDSQALAAALVEILEVARLQWAMGRLQRAAGGKEFQAEAAPIGSVPADVAAVDEGRPRSRRRDLSSP